MPTLENTTSTSNSYKNSMPQTSTFREYLEATDLIIGGIYDLVEAVRDARGETKDEYSKRMKTIGIH